MFETNGFPKKIWSYWDNTPPDFINQCIQSWRTFNPDYTIVLLNKQNLEHYLPEVDFTSMKHINDTPQRFSDMVRLYILEKEGGFWVDASIICQQSFDWIQNIQKEKNSEFFGYYLHGFTKPEFESYSPVIENWFFASIPHSPFIKDWLNEFKEILKYNTVEEYVDKCKQEIDIQKITIPYYLSMHVSAQKILQTNKDKYNIYVIKADNSALKSAIDSNWDEQKTVNEVLKMNYLDQPIIKLRGHERRIMEQSNYSDYFKKILGNQTF
jgi:hypothetical protein